MLPAIAVRRAVPWLIVIGSMALGAAYAAYLGEDANWDWQNYHEYNIWALLHGGYDRDAIPPGFQTFFNPLIYFPWYGLRHTLPPLAAGMIIGAVHGLNLATVAWLSRIMLGRAANAWTIGAAVLLAAFGPMTMSEVGTSFSDILTSIPSLAALALILEKERPRPWRYLAAGLLLGLTVGIKLTNIVFAIGLAAMALAAVQPLLAMTCLAIGGAVGSVLTGGAWSWMLWREFGNPFFPLVNSFFPSAEMKQVTLLDRQFIPRSFWDGASYPFRWVIGDYRSSELPFRDARFALAIVLLPLAIMATLKSAAARLTRRDAQLLIFFAVSLAIWLALFSIQRYIVLLELLCGPVIVLLLTRIAAAFAPGRNGGFAIFAAAAIASAWTQPTDWWRRPWSTPYAPAIEHRLAQPATYFLLDKPLSFIAPRLPAGSRFNMIADQALPIMPGGRFDRRIREGLNHPLPGGVWELHLKGRRYPVELLAGYGLRVDATQACVEIEGANPGSVLVACPLAAPR
jgi:hypothetical protein